MMTKLIIPKLKIITCLLCCFTMSACLAARRYGNQFCADPEYTCIHIKRGQSWDSLFPNDNQRELVQRLNRINIPLHSGMKIAVPKKLTQTNLWDISPFPLLINPLGQKMLVVDPGSLAWGAYDPHGNRRICVTKQHNPDPDHMQTFCSD